MLISTGILRGAWLLLNYLKTNKVYPKKFIHEPVIIDYFGRVSKKRILELCFEVKWLSVDENGILFPSDEGISISNILEPRDIIRYQLRTIIFQTRPSWARGIQYGRSQVLKTMNRDIYQCFREAGLVLGNDEQTVKWWDILGLAARGFTDENLLGIGRVGERRSIIYETQRTGKEPRYIALESAFPGYDLLSIIEKGSSERLCIEVKTSEKDLQYATFYVSRNEYEHGLLKQNYVFHLWLVKNLEKPIVVPFGDIEVHCPKDNRNGEWKSVEIPFRAFTGGV